MKIGRLLFLALAATAFLSSCSGKADRILIGNVITMDKDNTVAEAVAFKNGKVLFVGSIADAAKYRGKRTVVNDYGTASIYPGFMDGHTHGALAASRFQEADLTDLDFDNNTRMTDFVEAMRVYVKEHPGQSLYKGSGWTVKDVMPDAAMLDAICPEVPMILSSGDGHSMWLNTAAMKAYGIDAAAAEKYGTDCVRLGADGNPTGYVSEVAVINLLKATAIDKEACRKGLLMWQDYAFSQGVTATTEACLHLSSPYAAQAYDELVREGRWKLRTYAVECIDESVPEEKLDSALNNVLRMHRRYDNEYFKVTGVKLFMDGVVEAHTGWLDDEYSDQPGYYGLIRCPDSDRVARIVAFANGHGMNVHFHSIGDAATRTAVEGIIKGQDKAGVKDGRNAVSHLQVVHPEDIARMADNRIIAVVAPLWAPKYPFEYEYTCQYLGKRADTQYPVKSFYDAGTNVNFHSDFPISASLSMPQNIYSAVTRTLKYLGEEGVHNYPEHISRLQALQAVTVNVPYQWGEEDRLGSLEVGKVANAVVCDSDFLNDDLSKVFDSRVLETIVDGETVFRIANFSSVINE